MNWTVTSETGEELLINEKDIEWYRAAFFREAHYARRVADLFVVDLIAMERFSGVPAEQIVLELQNLETGDRSLTKPASRLKRKKSPLRGLWHKHYFAAHFIPANLQNELKRIDVEKVFEDELSNASGDSEIASRRIAHRLVEGAFSHKSDEQRLTGEWILFIRRGGENYYLTLATHKQDDADVYDRIVSQAAISFPEVSTWMREAASELDRT